MYQFEDSEQQNIRASVRSFAESELPALRSHSDLLAASRAAFGLLAEQGLCGLAIADEHDGTALSAVTTMIVMEELAAFDLGSAVSLSVHAMVTKILGAFAPEALQKELLPRAAAGEVLCGFALTEPGAGSDAAALATVFESSGDGYILKGEKCYITNAGIADFFILFARTAGSSGREGVSAFLVPRDTKGLSIGLPEKKMGCSLSTIASLNLDGALIPKDHLVGDEGDGYRIALSGLAGGRINIAACANGLARTALKLALQHLKERQQFGHALIEFQGLQFMLADMQMKLEAAQLLTWQAAHELDQDAGRERLRLSPSLAKCFATDVGMEVTTDAVQLLGGAGYIEEYQVERLMRDAKMLQIVEGTNQIQRSVIARALIENS